MVNPLYSNIVLNRQNLKMRNYIKNNLSNTDYCGDNIHIPIYPLSINYYKYRDNISSILSRNFETFASDFSEYHTEMFPLYCMCDGVTGLTT